MRGFGCEMLIPMFISLGWRAFGRATLVLALSFVLVTLGVALDSFKRSVASLTPGVQPQTASAWWSEPVSLVSSHGRLAVGNRVHVVGHIDGKLVHRSSQDNGATWSDPTVIAEGSQAYPMQYGGLYAVGDTVYLLTAEGHMGPRARHLDFRKSTDNGATWSDPVRITGPNQECRRARIVVSGNNVHVLGGGPHGIFYFRSRDGGATWDPGVMPIVDDGEVGAQTIAVDGNTLHLPYTKVRAGVGGGDTFYIRSTDNGKTWSKPVYIGEKSPESDRQARVQVVAADGRVLVVWQREGVFTGAPVPRDRLGYNRSNDGGVTWLGPKVLPGDSGVDRNHQQVWMVPGGGVHLTWLHGSPNDSSPAGYMFSPDYGATWGKSEIAISTPGTNLPHSIVTDTKWVHIIAEPGVGAYAAGTYARRPVGVASPSPPR